MSPMLTSLSAVNADVERAAAVLGRAPRLMTTAALDTDVPLFLSGLVARLGEGAVLVRLPPSDDLDAPLHGLLQAAGCLGRGAVERAVQDDVDLRARAADIGRELAKQDRVLILELPISWQSIEPADDPGAHMRHHHAQALIGGWLGAARRVVVVAGAGTSDLVRRAEGGAAAWQEMELAPARIDPAALADEPTWGAYAAYANVIARALGAHPDPSPPPRAVRLAVALLGLQEPESLVLRRLSLSRTRSSYAMEGHFRQALESPRGEEVRSGVLRFLQARWPLPTNVARRIAGLPDEHAPLVTACLGAGAGDELVEAAPSVKLGLRRLARRSGGRGLAEARMALADHHESLDGARSPADAWRSIVHWLEKAHHLGQSGAEGAARWQALERPARELFWDRARSLSVEHGEHLAAAELYRECLQRFDDRDAYSWHYLGYNLDRAGRSRKEAERAFCRAVELRPDHPWYNGRLVTFLIEQARFRDAEEEWRRAIERMDPRGVNASSSPWLCREAHRWVARAWLRSGEVRRAREVLDDIPAVVFEREGWFVALRHDLADAEEALALGDSVYPPETPMDERWEPPAVVPARDAAGRALRAWFPGRVVGVEAGAVHVALAVPHEDARERRLIARTLTPEEWKRVGFCPAEEAEGWYLFLAVYGDAQSPEEVVEIHAVPHRERPTEEAEILHETRYLAETRA